MMALVRVALTRPLTFIVMAVLIFGLGILSVLRMPVDIFPRIGVPVIATAWTYNGLSPEDMAGRIINPFERVLTTTVNDIDRIESQSMNGVGVVRIYFQPGADIRTATAQVTSISQFILRQLPPGISPPFIVNYDASTVPIVQLALSGAAELGDLISSGHVDASGLLVAPPPRHKESKSVTKNMFTLFAPFDIALWVCIVALIVLTATTDTAGCEINMTPFYAYPCVCILIGVLWAVRAVALRRVLKQARQESLLPTAVAGTAAVTPTPSVKGGE